VIEVFLGREVILEVEAREVAEVHRVIKEL
jgi:hypothetical protein